MPRKIYKQKNRYVYNANLSEEVFLGVLEGWCHHETAADTAERVSKWALGNGDKSISRESVSKYFKELGVHLWVASGLCGFLKGQKLFAPESVEARDLAVVQVLKLYDIIAKKYDLDRLRDQRLTDGMTWSVYSDLPVMALMHEFKMTNGFPKEWTHAHISRSFILTALVTDDGLKPDEAVDTFYCYMVSFLENYPLRKPLPEDKFLWREGWSKGLSHMMRLLK
ncbi:MAG: hypothetical protein ACRBB4_15690 [Neptuniibacter sp.]